MTRQRNNTLISKQLEKITDLEYKKLKNKMLVSANIDRLLKKKEISKKELADALGKTPSEATRWLSGTLNIKMDTQTEIAHYFGVQVYELSMPIDEKPITKMYFINTNDAMSVSITNNEWGDVNSEIILPTQIPISHGGKC